MGNTGTGEALGDDADHDPEHGGAAVEQLNAFQLLQMDLLNGAVLIPLVVGGRICHDFNRDRSGTGFPGP